MKIGFVMLNLILLSNLVNSHAVIYKESYPKNIKSQRRDLATTITSSSAWVSWIGAATKYWRNIGSSSSIGYWCGSGESGSTWTSSETLAWSDDTTSFPSSTSYNLCPISETTSVWGISSSKVIRVFDGEDIAFIAYTITSGELCLYTFRVLDPLITSFQVKLVVANNLNVMIAQQTSTSSYASPQSLTVGSTITQTATMNDQFRISAVSNGGGEGTLAIFLTVPHTGYGDEETDNTAQTLGIIFAIYFGLPWTILIVIMALLYCFKKRKNSPKVIQRRNISQPHQNQYQTQYNSGMFDENYVSHQNSSVYHNINQFAEVCS